MLPFIKYAKNYLWPYTLIYQVGAKISRVLRMGPSYWHVGQGSAILTVEAFEILLLFSAFDTIKHLVYFLMSKRQIVQHSIFIKYLTA